MTARKTKRRFVECTDGRKRCEYTVKVWLDRDEVALFERIAELEHVSFFEAVQRSAMAGIRDAQPLDDRDYSEPAK